MRPRPRPVAQADYQADPREAAPPHDAAQVLVDRGGLVRFWSKGCERLFGYTSDYAVAQSVEFIIVPSHRACHHDGFTAEMARTAIERAQAAGNLPILHADGSVHAHPFRQILLYDAFGRSTGAIVIFSDPTSSETVNGLPDVFPEVLEEYGR